MPAEAVVLVLETRYFSVITRNCTDWDLQTPTITHKVGVNNGARKREPPPDGNALTMIVRRRLCYRGPVRLRY